MRSADVNIKVDIFVENDIIVDLLKVTFKKGRLNCKVSTESYWKSSTLVKGWSSSLRALSTATSEIPAFLKQLVKVLYEAAFQAFLYKIIDDIMAMVGIGAFVSKADVNLWIDHYLGFKVWITTGSMGWVCLFVCLFNLFNVGVTIYKV